MLLFRDINWSTVAITVGIMVGIAILLGVAIMLVSKAFFGDFFVLKSRSRRGGAERRNTEKNCCS